MGAAQYPACIQPFHRHDRIIASGLDDDPQPFVQRGQTLTNEIAGFHIMPIHALTATLTSPMSGSPMNTSPKMNNASLTSIFP